MTVHIVARFIARPECVDQLRTLLLGLLAPTRRETGCLRYDLLHNTAEPTDFTFVEEWADEATLAAHLQTAHLQAAVAQSQALLAAPLEVRRYRVC